MRLLLAVVALACCLACGDGNSKTPDPKTSKPDGPTVAPRPSDPAAVARTRELLPKLADQAALEEVVSLGAVEPLIDALAKGEDEELYAHACVALGEIGGVRAREALIGVLQAPSPEPQRDGPRRLYAAVGLTRMKDPATAIALIESLSKVNPNDNIAALAREERNVEYFTIDAQICEALLAMGLFAVEEDLVEQMKRRDRIRVLIDAYAILRRETGFDLPFHYNGSYADRNAQAEAWRTKLRATRAEREDARPFDAKNEIFRRECGRVIAWLSGRSMNNRLIAHRVLDRVGRPALAQLEEELRSERGVTQRQAAYMMGRIGHISAAPALLTVLNSKDADARAEAIDALRLVGESKSGALIVPRLKDSDPEVRAAAARYLGRSGGDTAKAALMDTVQSELLPAAKAAMWSSLLRLGESSALEPVLEIFVAGEQIERQAAEDALEAWGARQLDSSATDPEEARRAAAEAFRQG